MADQLDILHPERRTFLQNAAAIAVGLGLSAPGVSQAAAKPLRGLYPIGQTPFTPDNKLDLDCLAAEVKFCNRGRVPGLIWPQIASGWSNLSQTERLSGAETLIATGKGGKTSIVIGVQTVGNDLAASVGYAKHAAKTGADAIVSLPPDKADDQAMLDYYKAIGAATDLPLIVQSQGNMSVDLIVRLAEQIPTMKCVKDEAGDPLARISEIRARTKDRIAVFAGKGVRTMLDELNLGFAGFCPTPGLADLFQATAELWDAGRKQEAFDMFGRIQGFSTIPGAGAYIMVARGVFKESTMSRPTPGMGGHESPPSAAQKAFIRQTMDQFLKPYMRA